jgi:hypothetical protein
LQALETWFFQRSGQELSAAARLLWHGADTPAVDFRRRLVLTVSAEEIADGLMQWPETRGYIRERLGPTALEVDEGAVEGFQERLRELGVEVKSGEPAA